MAFGKSGGNLFAEGMMRTNKGACFSRGERGGWLDVAWTGRGEELWTALFLGCHALDTEGGPSQLS